MVVLVWFVLAGFFFFKQKTAYEMRISDWSSDVCSSDLLCSAADIPIVPFGAGTSIEGNALAINGGISLVMSQMDQVIAVNAEDFDCVVQPGEIGRASCRERVCQYV